MNWMEELRADLLNPYYVCMDMRSFGYYLPINRKQCGRGGCRMHYYPELLPYVLICL